MKKLVFKKDIVEALSNASMQTVQGGQIIINTSTRPIQTVINTDPTKTVDQTVLYTKFL